MPEKLTLENLKKYVTEFCAITLAKAYSNKEVLSGHELLKLTPVRRINQHIVSRLSTHWNSQVKNLNSPYFDFESGEVRAALEHFSNVVSQHIALRKEHLQPWLLDIVEKTLAPLSAASEYSDEDEVLAAQFSTVHPFPVEIRKTVATSPIPPKSVSFFDLAEQESEPVVLQKPVIETPIRADLETENFHQKIESAEPQKIHKSRLPESINSRYQVNTPPVSSELNYGSVKVKLESIAKSISLAQRFMFVGQLFKGDADAFVQSVQSLDNSENWETAESFVTKDLAVRYDWDLESEPVTELLTLVKRRFS